MPKSLKSRKKKKKNRLPEILLILVFLIGLGLVLYPTISEYFISLHQSSAIVRYNDVVLRLDPELVKKLWKEADTYNDKLYQKSCGVEVPDEEIPSYQDLLNIYGDGMMAFIDIPKIDVHLPIFHGVGEGTLQTYLGHMEGTSLPVGGVNTHCVITGHRGLPSATLFTYLDAMELGDEFTVRTLQQDLLYRVDDISVVLPYEAEHIAIVPGEDYFTLVTCTPYGVNSHRLLVRGKRVLTEPEPAETEPVTEPGELQSGEVTETVPHTEMETVPVYQGVDRSGRTELFKKMIPLAAALFAIILLIIALILAGRKRKKDDEEEEDDDEAPEVTEAETAQARAEETAAAEESVTTEESATTEETPEKEGQDESI